MLRLPEIRCPRIPSWDGVSLDALRGGWSDTTRLYLCENGSGQRPQWGTEVRRESTPNPVFVPGSRALGYSDREGPTPLGGGSGRSISRPVWRPNLLFCVRSESSV